MFSGHAIGIAGIRVGELVFNTAMTGYQETLTDPSYKQQIITFTYPHIGNTGINLQDMQSKQIHAAGLVVKSLSTFTSNWRATISLQEFLVQQNVVGIAGVDTRSLTKVIRERGSLRACIMHGDDSGSAIKLALQATEMQGADLTQELSTKDIYTLQPQCKLHIVLYDFGVKQNIIDCLIEMGCKVTVVPANTPAQQVIALRPNGILLSNGPGDPAACTDIIANVKILLNSNLPIFGICLGHQLLALALGARTYKMEFGHHGSNHPVQDIKNNTVLITSQNHGFAVLAGSLPADVVITHKSLFDNSLQGFRHTQRAIFGFQGHPEAAPGPQDAKHLFTEFLNSVREYDAQT